MSLTKSDTNALIKARLLLARIDELLSASLRSEEHAPAASVLLRTGLQYCDAILLLARTKRNAVAILALQQSLYLTSMEMTWAIANGNTQARPSASPRSERLAQDQLRDLQPSKYVLGPLKTGLSILSSEIDWRGSGDGSAKPAHTHSRNAALEIPLTTIEVCLIATTMSLQFAILVEHENVARAVLLSFLNDFLSPVLEDMGYYSAHVLDRGGPKEQEAHQRIQDSLHAIYQISGQVNRADITFASRRKTPHKR